LWGVYLSCQQGKKNRFKRLLESYGRVGVAFSGGVDSSFLLKTSIDVLGSSNVLVLYAITGLVGGEEERLAETWLERHSLLGVDFLSIKFNPLTWKPFVDNSESRCYYCKFQMYQKFKSILGQYGICNLLDGTNQDDLQGNRPGLKAIKELGVKMPLVYAKLSKTEIRLLSREVGLDTWALPSSSCLATRIPHGMAVTKDRLATVAGLEEIMGKFGFYGCRVRLHLYESEAVFLQLQKNDFERFACSSERLKIIHCFGESGVNRIFLDLAGR
jgi:uncharacterized protein